MTIHFKFGKERLDLRVHEYHNNKAMAVVAEDRETGDRYAVVSTNLEQPPAPGCFWLKDWSENEPLASALLREGVVELTGRTCQSGFVTVKEARFKR